MNNDFIIAKSVLSKEGRLIGVTSGDSMRPLFRNGRDKAVIVPLGTRLKVNDVLLYRKASTDEVILHRIVKIKNGAPILRGDNTFYNENNVPLSDILGVMEGFYRKEKYYDCKKSRGYKLYILALRAVYPIRRLWHKFMSFLKIIKRKLNAPA